MSLVKTHKWIFDLGGFYAERERSRNLISIWADIKSEKQLVLMEM